MTSTHFSDLAAILGHADAVIADPQMLERLSKDFYWYSPILKALLEDKRAEAVVQPRTWEEVQNVLRYCFDQGIPVTVRGSGTGNYGQAIPLEGGERSSQSRLGTSLLSLHLCQSIGWRFPGRRFRRDRIDYLRRAAR